MKSIVLTICAVTLIWLSARCLANTAQDSYDGDTPVTLQEYLRCAALNNAGLKAVFEQWKAALQQIPQAGALPDPQFTYGNYIDEVETKEGPRSQNLQLMQMFPWFGTIQARTDAAAAAAQAAKKRYEAAKLELFFEVKDAFFEYVYLASAIEIAKENLELAKHFEEVARIKYTTSEAGHPDVIRAQLEIAKMADELKALEELRKPLSARLNAALNRKDPNVLPWPEKGQFKTVALSRQQLIETLKSRNPEIAALDFELQAARSRLELAKKRFYPDLSLGVEWMTNEGMMGTGLKNSEKDEVVVMFGVNLPIWRESYKAGQLQAKADMAKASQQKTQTENTLAARAAQVLYEFEDSRRKRELYGDTLAPKAQQLLAASEVAYKAGTVDFLSLIDAQRTLLNFKLLYERAGADNQQRLAELEMLAGAELTNSAEETTVGKSEK
jgi:cobalt-zinc-cadmium efflux system outer membrane protein